MTMWHQTAQLGRFRSGKAVRGNGMRFRLMVTRWKDKTPGIRNPSLDPAAILNRWQFW